VKHLKNKININITKDRLDQLEKCESELLDITRLMLPFTSNGQNIQQALSMVLIEYYNNKKQYCLEVYQKHEKANKNNERYS
jgi:hypothetical protein